MRKHHQVGSRPGRPAYRTAAAFRAKQFPKLAGLKAGFKSTPKRGNMNKP